MAVIVPRWEWRTFGTRFAAAEAAFAALESSGVQESDELYLLALGGDNVKVRDDLMDIKVLRETDARGLERWEPVMKASFPLSPADATTVVAALGLPPRDLGNDPYPLDRFIAEVVEPSGVLRAVNVHKRRVRYTVNGCTSEVSDVEAGGRHAVTIAIESPDADAVVAAVAQVGLGDYVNTSYPKGLAALLDDLPPRFAVIDVGTNSVKFHVGERHADGTWDTLVDRAVISRLGEGIEATGVIGPEPLGRTLEAIAGMAGEARAAGVRAIAAVGTEGLRKAHNGPEVVERMAAETGIRIQVLSGEDEGRLAYLAVKVGLGLAPQSLVVFDTGGGSSQFTFGHGDQVDERFSVDVGAVRYTERFDLAHAVGRDVVDEAIRTIAGDLSRLSGRESPEVLVGMGGAVTNITAVKHEMATYDPDVVQGTVLERSEIERQIELYRSRDADGRRTIVGLQPKRAEVILAGACIVATIMDTLGRSSLTVSDRGLRHGVLAERFGRPEQEGTR